MLALVNPSGSDNKTTHFGLIATKKLFDNMNDVVALLINKEQLYVNCGRRGLPWFPGEVRLAWQSTKISIVPASMEADEKDGPGSLA